MKIVRVFFEHFEHLKSLVFLVVLKDLLKLSFFKEVNHPHSQQEKLWTPLNNFLVQLANKFRRVYILDNFDKHLLGFEFFSNSQSLPLVSMNLAIMDSFD